MYCVSGLIFGGTEGVESRFHVLRSRNRFRRYRGRPLPFSCFSLPDMFLGLPRASCPFFTFCTPGLVFGGTEGVRSLFHVLSHPKSFSGLPRASCPFFTFCTPGLVFGGTEGVRSLFHVLRPQTHFRRYRGRRLLFSCFAFPDSFSAVPRASSSFFIFFAPRIVFGGTDGFWSRFHVLRTLNRFRRYRGHRVPFSCFARQTHFRRYRRRPVPFSCFASPVLFSAVPKASGLVLRVRTHFRMYRLRRVPFSSFACPDSFSVVPRASGLVFKFCAPGLVFGGTMGVRSRFYVFHSRTCSWGYRGRRVPFSRFVLPDSSSAVPRASCPIFMFCAPGPIFGGIEGVCSRFHVLRSRTRFRRYRGRRVPFSCFALSASFLSLPRT
jgi:hypothetical protein